MPSGYTAPLYEGKDLTFREFVMRCARGMGALASMRDHSLDAEIPEKLVPDCYHEKQIGEWKAALGAAEAMTDAEADRAATEEHEAEVRLRKESAKRRRALRDCYERMLAQVEAWTPPTPDHVNLKQFMMAQLRESLRYDCCEFDWPAPERVTGAAFRQRQIDNARSEIARHEEELAKERWRCDQANAWLSALRASLVVER